MSNVQIEPLAKHHDREGFDCEVEALNNFLQTMAMQHQKKGISRTHVLTYKDQQAPVIAFATLNVCDVDLSAERETAVLKKLPMHIPALRLCRLAVHKDHKRKGIGAHMMAFTLQKAMDVSENVGCAGVVVDAKDEDAKAYYEQYGFIPFTADPLRLFLPMKTISDLLT